MRAMVRKSSPVVVMSSMPVMTTGRINLSSFDKGLEALATKFSFVFDNPINIPAETIQSALSQALVHYYPIAGRLALGADDGQLYIKCTSEGVMFVAASAHCGLTDGTFFDQSLRATPLLINELAVDYPGEACSRKDPLLLMQVTEFSCGGFVIRVTWNHDIADAAGMGQFLQALGELARGLSAPTIAPVRHDDSLPGLPPVSGTEGEIMTNLKPRGFAFLDITIPWSLINHIKDKFCHSHSSGESCTVFEALAAVLWQCRTRATMSDPEAATMLFFTSNVRKHVGAKDGYYGNCVRDQSVTATSGLVANGDLIEIVEMIKRAKAEIPNKLLKEKDGGGSLPQASPDKDSDILGNTYNNLGISSMRNLGLDMADFGCGRPARVMCHVPKMHLPICAACLPWKGVDGASVLSRCVKEGHAGAFLAELARFTA